mgnify:CR=1 FL=1
MKETKKRFDNVIGTALDCDTYKKLLKIATEEDRTIASVVRRLIVEGVNKYER